MGHALIDEFCRARELRPEFFRRCQRVFREEVQTQLDEREALLAENAALKERLSLVTVETHVFGMDEKPARRKAVPA